jgi:diguanylate cyclase (GGDEF)-like protein
MLRVYSCITQEHDLRLIPVAAVICLLAAFTSFCALDQAGRDSARKALWIALAGFSAGLGIWATHFVAMLAYEPGLPVGYDLETTLLSVAAAVVITTLGWAVALKKHPLAPQAAGAIIGAGVGTMHYIGMSAVEVGGFLAWNRPLVTASLVIGLTLAAAALQVHRAQRRGSSWAAPLLLTAAICGLHFTAMAAAVIYPNTRVEVPVASIESGTLAIVVTVAALLILATACGLILAERRLARAQLAEAQEKAALADEILRGAAERELLTAELKRQAGISAAALGNIAQGLAMFDERDGLITYNQRYAELYDLPDELLAEGTALAQIVRYLVENEIFPDTREYYAEQTRNAHREPSQMEVHLLTGKIVNIQRRPLPNGGWVATHEDVTEVRLANQRIAYLAAHDTLTGLPNRAAFTDQLNAAASSLGRGARFAVLTIDLDRFKEVNDTLGHPIGDEILKQTATRLRRIVRTNDVVTRLGGDEFAILQRGLGDPAAAGALAARVVEGLSEPFEFEGHTIAIGASIGISLAPDDGVSGDELLKMSDLALYRAKADSRGTYRYFERGMDSRLRERRQIETDLRAAIQEGQFEVHYQPLLDLGSGAIDCFEALVRWHHPTRGLVQPLDFIPIAEETGLIIPIGEWVLRQACRDAASWPSNIRVAVNLSPAQFKRGDLLAMTTSALAASGVEPARLELEITESVLLHDESWVRTVLQQLASLGVRIAMDDFGTGYSSLSYLRSFPFTKIKIDRSFIADLAGTTDSLAIVQATIQLSEKLGMQTTAEGVETAEQLEILAAEGCTQVQGYHVSRPIPAAGIAGLLGSYEQWHERLKRAG